MPSFRIEPVRNPVIEPMIEHVTYSVKFRIYSGNLASSDRAKQDSCYRSFNLPGRLDPASI